MSKYWPEGLELSDTQSPIEILRDAQNEWQSRSGGVLTLVLQEAESEAGYDMIIIHAKHVASNRTASLFSVFSRKGNPYPVRLQPKEDQLPNFFKKGYKKPGLKDIISMSTPIYQLNQERWVNNEWVSETPGEFRNKLREVFNLGNIKSEIFNLVTCNSQSNDVVSTVSEEAEDLVVPILPPSEKEANSG